ncbi:hypothetical protein OPT61_g6316 [Boeremia exigua]|uniref:Uncharacterized protein n=1 Tax=Boeremia exigua TaxID=749465 RepID=A0ACC2I714_9PLEO|nr:hypothetical protein OPT61_g6316 [Boeremia exigua]
MAPRKPKLKAEPTQPVRPNAAKITKSKSVPRAGKQPEESYRMKRYKNGLLNLEETPAHLVATVKLNAESPLLRLPAEIRNKIWSFACGGQLVELPRRMQRDHTVKKSRTVKGGAVRFWEYCRSRNVHVYNESQRSRRIIAAFHLPEVCRQIYAETALTSYRENVFLYDYDNKSMVLALMAAQRRAITTLQPSEMYFSSLVNYGDSLFELCREAMELVKSRCCQNKIFSGVETYEIDNMKLWAEVEWRKLVAEQLTFLTNAGVELVYEE